MPDLPAAKAARERWLFIHRRRERELRSCSKGIRLKRKMATACKHPRVRIVSRHDDTEFVECLECGEIFDSEEFRDMELEETPGTESLPDEP